jgi:hypothetical protein
MGVVCFLAFEALDNVDMHIHTKRNDRMCMRRGRACGGNVEIIALDLLLKFL